eukprot:5941346-Prymnesium_polylepis.1
MCVPSQLGAKVAATWFKPAQTVVAIEKATLFVIFTLLVVSTAPWRTSTEPPAISKPPPVRWTFSRCSLPPSATSKWREIPSASIMAPLPPMMTTS